MLRKAGRADLFQARPVLNSDAERQMMAKGTYAALNLATADLDDTFAKLEASGAEVVR